MSATALRTVPTRTLANVLLDIAEARRVWTRHWNTEGEGDHLARLDELQAEARAMLEAATGVSWNQISEACL